MNKERNVSDEELINIADNILSTFISDDLFSWGYWDGYDDLSEADIARLDDLYLDSCIVDFKFRNCDNEK